MITTSLGELREEALALSRENYALAILVQGTTKDTLDRHHRLEEKICGASRALLDIQIAGSRVAIKRLKEHMGCTADRGTLLQLYQSAFASRPGEVVYLLKSRIKEMCSKYDQVLPDFYAFPQHAQISMERGELRDEVGKVKIRVSEAVVCEDMCALFNEAESAHRAGRHASARAPERKAAAAILRATVTCAYRLLEAYLNGKAHDRLASDNETLKASERDLLQEWDSKGKRHRFLRLGDKIKAFHRLLAMEAAGELSEETNPALARVIAMSVSMRNPLVHPKPSTETREVEPGRNEFVSDVDFSEVRALVLDVLSVIRAFEVATSGGTQGITLWFPKLGEDSRFGDDAFE